MTKIRPTRIPRHGFTLIELLVVVAIISLLAAILFPVFSRARENARRTACMSNCKQLGVAALQYSQDYDEYIVPAKNSSVSWRQILYPYLKNSQVLICPDRQDPIATGWDGSSISYAGNWIPQNPNFGDGAGGMPDGTGSGLVSEITYPSSTIFLVEDQYCLQYIIDIADSTSVLPLNSTTENLTSGQFLWAGHMGTSVYVFSDGHAKALRPDQTLSPVNMWTRNNANFTATWPYPACGTTNNCLANAQANIATADASFGNS